MNNMKKNVLWNAIGTTCNAFNSLFFMMIVTRINGIEDSGIFTMAFSLACLFCLFGGYEGRVFQVTDMSGKTTDMEYILHRYLTSIIAVLITIGYCLFMSYDRQRFLITLCLCVMKILEMLADVYYGILQKHEELYVVGQSLFLKSLVSFIVFLVVDLLLHNLIYACIALDIVWVLFLLVFDIPRAHKHMTNKQWTVGHIGGIFKTGFFAFSILFLAIYLVNAPKYALDGRVDSSLQAIYGIILMPATFLSLVVQYIIQPILNQLAGYFRKGEKKIFNSLVFKVVAGIAIFGLVVVGVAWLMGIPVLNILYGVNINDYKLHLIIIVIGAVLYSISTLLSAALTTVRYTFIQFIVFLISSGFGFFISIFLIEHYAILGASLAYLAIMVCQLVLYLVAYYWVMKRIKFNREENEYGME